jgi:hypothetical protein
MRVRSVSHTTPENSDSIATPLLEKAYTNFHDNYASLNSNDAFQALESLTR